MYKIIGADGRQYGPVSLEQLRSWISENRLRGDTPVQPEGASDWKPLSSFPELAAELKPPAAFAPPHFNPELAARASNKIAAGICGILLGGLGVHKFILGYTGAGLLMLLISLLSCLAAYPVIHLIGLIEGIIYLTKTDEEFVRVYVDGRREWF